MSERIIINVEGTEYEVVLSSEYRKLEDKKYRRICHATLIRLPERSVFAGAAVCHPIDQDNLEVGYRLAFKRAVSHLYMARLLKAGRPWRTDQWKAIYKGFRMVFGKALYQQMHSAEIE